MKHRLSEHAEADLLAAVAYYEARKHGLGLEFALEVGLALARVLEAPQRWPQFEAGYRKYSLDRFPYALVLSDATPAAGRGHGNLRPPETTRELAGRHLTPAFPF